MLMIKDAVIKPYWFYWLQFEIMKIETQQPLPYYSKALSIFYIDQKYLGNIST